LLAVHNRLFSVFTPDLYIHAGHLYPQAENVPCHNDKGLV